VEVIKCSCTVLVNLNMFVGHQTWKGWDELVDSMLEINMFEELEITSQTFDAC